MRLPSCTPTSLTLHRDVLAALQTTRPLFTSYLRIRSLASSPSSPELTQARTELEAALGDVTSDLHDLIDSVRAAEKDPFRYGLDLEEVGRRARFVEDVGSEVEGMGSELRGVVAGAGTDYARNSGRNPLPSPGTFEDEFAGAGDDGDYDALEQERQVQIMNEQDEALDGVFQTVGNLRAQADVMGRELEEQEEMLGDVDGLVDRVGGKLKGGLKRIEGVVRAGEGLLWKYHF